MATKTSKKTPKLAIETPSLVAAPPPAGVPAPPAGYVHVRKGRLYLPERAQVAAASTAAAELRRATSYAADFGKSAPDPVRFASSLERSAAWSAEVRATMAWLAYAKDQEFLAWRDALAMTRSLRVPFAFANENDASIPTRYAAVHELVFAPSARARKSAGTRRKQAKNEEPASAPPAPADAKVPA